VAEAKLVQAVADGAQGGHAGLLQAQGQGVQGNMQGQQKQGWGQQQGAGVASRSMDESPYDLSHRAPPGSSASASGTPTWLAGGTSGSSGAGPILINGQEGATLAQDSTGGVTGKAKEMLQKPGSEVTNGASSKSR
jgi:hypothetical protein